MAKKTTANNAQTEAMNRAVNDLGQSVFTGTLKNRGYYFMSFRYKHYCAHELLNCASGSLM
jgi:hypothetical protein